MKNKLIFFLIIITNFCNAQSLPSFYKTFIDSSSISGVNDVQRLNNNFQLAGIYNKNDTSKGYLLEVDSIGNIIKQSFLSNNPYKCTGLGKNIITSNKNYSFGGSNLCQTLGDPFNTYITASLRNNDSVLWRINSNNINNDNSAVQLLYKNNLLHVLSTIDYYEKSSRANLMVLDTNGTVILDKDIQDTTYKYNFMRDFTILPDSSYFVLGYRENPVPMRSGRIWIQHWDKLGNVLMSKNVLDSDYVYFTKMLPINDTEIVTSGSHLDWNGSGNYITCLLKMNLNGDVKFNKLYSYDSIITEGDNYYNRIIKTNSNDYLIHTEMLLYKVDANGTLIWKNNLINSIDGFITNTIETINKGFYIFGNVKKSSNNSDQIIFMALVDSLGNFEFATTINPITKEKESFTIYPNPSNSVININSTMHDDIKEIVLYNSMGVFVNKYNSNINKIDLSKYANGQYFLKISYNQKFETKKIIKQ
jgi:hypothetical protein